MLSFFPRGVLDEILNLIESVSEGFPCYSFITSFNGMLGTSARHVLKALHSTFPIIPSIIQRHYFLFLIGQGCVRNVSKY